MARVRGVLLCSSMLGILALAACGLSPTPIQDAEFDQRAKETHESLFAAQPPIEQPLTLPEAVARAIAYNYDHRQAMMEEALQSAQLDLAQLDLLPELAANAGYTFRQPERASSSESITTRRQSLEASTSEETARLTGDLTFSWNVIDFGVSYFTAKQQSDRVLIAVERRRRILNNIVRDVLGSYYRAASAERLLPKVEQALAEAEIALENAREIEAQQLEPPLVNLNYQRTLLEIVGQLRGLASDLTTARIELASLIGQPPGVELDLADTEPPTDLPPLPQVDELEPLEVLALSRRPEMREEAYRTRVDRQDINKEILRLVPGVEALASLNYDSNFYLAHNFWYEVGSRATLNLIRLVKGPTALRAAEANVEVGQIRRLALGVSVLTQVNVAALQLRKTIADFGVALETARIAARIAEITGNALELSAQPELEQVQNAVSAIASELELEGRFADLQQSAAELYVSVGIDLLPADTRADDLGTLVVQVENALASRQLGGFATVGSQPVTLEYMTALAAPPTPAAEIAVGAPRLDGPDPDERGSETRGQPHSRGQGVARLDAPRLAAATGRAEAGEPSAETGDPAPGPSEEGRAEAPRVAGLRPRPLMYYMVD